jgi:hypothetical protein
MQEHMMKPVELKFCTPAEATELLGGNEMWSPHGNPFVDSEGVSRITMVKTVPVRMNFKEPNPSILVPQTNVRLN